MIACCYKWELKTVLLLLLCSITLNIFTSFLQHQHQCKACSLLFSYLKHATTMSMDVKLQLKLKSLFPPPRVFMCIGGFGCRNIEQLLNLALVHPKFVQCKLSKDVQ